MQLPPGYRTTIASLNWRTAVAWHFKFRRWCLPLCQCTRFLGRSSPSGIFWCTCFPPKCSLLSKNAVTISISPSWTPKTEILWPTCMGSRTWLLHSTSIFHIRKNGEVCFRNIQENCLPSVYQAQGRAFRFSTIDRAFRFSTVHLALQKPRSRQYLFNAFFVCTSLYLFLFINIVLVCFCCDYLLNEVIGAYTRKPLTFLGSWGNRKKVMNFLDCVTDHEPASFAIPITQVYVYACCSHEFISWSVTQFRNSGVVAKITVTKYGKYGSSQTSNIISTFWSSSAMNWRRYVEVKDSNAILVWQQVL